MQKTSVINPGLQKAEFEFWKANNQVDDQFVGHAVNDRISPQVSREMVGHVSLVRYFRLLELGRASLRGRFSIDEVFLLANTNAQSWWEGDLFNERQCTVANAVHWCYFDEDEGYPRGVLGLLEKLDDLNLIERLALVDVLETAHRDRKMLRQIFPE